MIKIERGIPVPKAGAQRKYPWGVMKISDSFLAAVNYPPAAAANKYYAPKRFASRKVDGGYRVWRVK